MPSFDGDNLICTLDAGVTSYDIEADIYSPWKTWALEGDNLRYEQMFRIVTSENITAALESGAYFFLQNQVGWRFRGPEENITIEFVGNLAMEDTMVPGIIPTIGAYTVLILGLQPVTQVVTAAAAGSGLTLDEFMALK